MCNCVWSVWTLLDTGLTGAMITNMPAAGNIILTGRCCICCIMWVKHFSLNNIQPVLARQFFIQSANFVIRLFVEISEDPSKSRRVLCWTCWTLLLFVWWIPHVENLMLRRQYVDKRPRLTETVSYWGFICSGNSSDNYSLFTLKIKIKKIICKKCNWGYIVDVTLYRSSSQKSGMVYMVWPVTICLVVPAARSNKCRQSPTTVRAQLVVVAVSGVDSW